MAIRKPLTLISGVTQEMPAADTLDNYAKDSFNFAVAGAPVVADKIFRFTKRGLTIAQINDMVAGSSTPSVTWNIRYASTPNAGSPTSVFSSNRATTAVAGASTTSFTNATIPADNWWWIEITAVSGTVTAFAVTVSM